MQGSDNWFDFVPVVAKPALYAYKYRCLIQEYWKKLQVAVGVGKPNVVITGRAGAGKSVLAAHYYGEASNLEWVVPSSSPSVEVKPINVGEWTKIVHVIPGQDSREREIGLDTAFNSHSGLEGVIHVVDWGYTAIRDSAVQNQIIASGVDTVEKIRRKNLQLEIDDFAQVARQISMSISAGRGPKWLVIAVNKVDLFESSLELARQNYHPSCNGEFSKITEDLLRKVGGNNLKIVCLPVCPQPEPFVWGGEKVTSQIDSVTRQRSYMRSFIDNVALVQGGVE